MPSEAEWEYACRAGGYHLYCGTNNIDELSWRNVEVEGQETNDPPPRGKPNAFGLYDMSGNAGELVQDCWHDDYNGAPSDGSVWADGECDSRIVRGGSWRDGSCPRNLRASNRKYRMLDERYCDFGFRVARDH